MPNIIVNYTESDRIIEGTIEALIVSDISNYLKKSDTVAIKPNLVLARPASGGATTHVEIVEGIIRFLKSFGINKITIMEGSWVGDSTKKAFRSCGYEDLSKAYGVPLIDLKTDKASTFKAHGLTLEVCKAPMEADFLINVPVLKAHCQTLLTCNLKNLKGCIPDNEKRKYHSLGIHKPVAVLNTVLKTGYCVVDGICGDLSFEEGGNPVESNRIILGRDPLMVDSFCAGLIGYEPKEIEYLLLAKEYGIGDFYSEAAEVKELNPERKTVVQAQSSGAAKSYNRYIQEDAACSACYSSLIYALHLMDKKKLNSLDYKIKIGQGFKGKKGKGTGVGNCTLGFDTCVKGCPPKAVDIIKFFS